jgi:hypothetical protein
VALAVGETEGVDIEPHSAGDKAAGGTVEAAGEQKYRVFHKSQNPKSQKIKIKVKTLPSHS